MSRQNPLVGKVITAMKIADDKQALLFVTPEGDIVVDADGDCCSHTWIEHVDLPALGFPATVFIVVDLNLDRPDEDDGGNVIQFYGCKINTDRGDIIIDYRNESNGYYGGSLVWPKEYHYGGVYGQNNSAYKWVDIVEVSDGRS